LGKTEVDTWRKTFQCHFVHYRSHMD